MSIERDLSIAKDKYLRIMGEYVDLQHQSNTNVQKIESIEALLKEAKESFCNVIDSACGHYIDGRLNKIRFKKMYADAFRSHVDNEEFSGKYNTTGSKYQSTIKCVKEWNPAHES